MFFGGYVSKWNSGIKLFTRIDKIELFINLLFNSLGISKSINKNGAFDNAEEKHMENHKSNLIFFLYLNNIQKPTSYHHNKNTINLNKKIIG